MMPELPEKVVYLMRGLPSCGKSTTSLRLAGETGVICETDAYFNHTREDGSIRYAFKKEKMFEARQWNFERYCRAVEEGRSPVVVDRGNGRNSETRRYALFAVEHGYRLELKEPEAPWWAEIRWLLQSKPDSLPLLRQWAEWLAEQSRSTHRVPVATIYRRMEAWEPDLTVERILA